jgi:hypothetical protein
VDAQRPSSIIRVDDMLSRNRVIACPEQIDLFSISAAAWPKVSLPPNEEHAVRSKSRT